MIRRLLIVLALLAPARTWAQPVVLDGAGKTDLSGRLTYLRDPSGNMSLGEAVQTDALPATRVHSFGFDNAAYWFSFEAENKTRQQDWLLEIPFAPLDHVEFFYFHQGTWNQKVAGDMHPVSAFDVRHQHTVFRFPLPPGERHRFFVRVKTTSSVQIPMFIWHPEAFRNRSFDLQIFNGLFYGAMLIMILYQLFLFFSTRDRIALYYVFTLFAMLHVVSFFQGYSFFYLFPESPAVNRYLAVLTGPVFLVFSTWLTRAFLRLKTINPWVDSVLILNTYADVLMGVLMLLWPGAISYAYHHYAILCHSVIALVAAAAGFYRGFRPALFYLLSWITLLLATFIFSLGNLGAFGDYLNTGSSGLIVACLFQMLFISFALGNRWNEVTKENQRAREAELERELRERERLEQEVKLRTEEIAHKNEKLEEVIRIKDKLFSVVSHDIKGPLTSLQLALALTKSGTLSQEEFRELTGALETRFTQTTEFIENLLQWASLQLKGGNFEPGPVDLHEMTANTFALLDFEIRRKEVSVHNEVPPGCKAFADVNMLRSVFRNLVMNAVKFTAKGGKVSIRSAVTGDHVQVSVSDTGVGIPAANREKVFTLNTVSTPGTKKEKGTGLGLLLCREFIERNGGRIWFESEEGKGTTFYFTLPLAGPARAE